MKFFHTFSIFLLLIGSQLSWAERPARSRTVAAEEEAVAGTPADTDPIRRQKLWEAKLDRVPYWSPEKAVYSVGYEAAASSLGVLGQNAVSFGTWVDGQLGFEGFFGYRKDANTTSESTTTSTNVLTESQTVVTSYTGSANPHLFTLGGVIKYRLYQNSWFQFTAGGIVGFVIGLSSESQTGTVTQNIPDTNDPTNKTVTETNYGTVRTTVQPTFIIGPKLQTEFYLKWFPHLALGFGTGVVAMVGGNTQTTTNTASRTYNVVDGVAQDPGAHSTSEGTTTTSYGLRGTTFGLGGTSFSFTGIFTIRYIW